MSEDNSTETGEETQETQDAGGETQQQTPKQKQQASKQRGAAKTRQARGRPKEKTVTIKLHNNNEIPPDGQFVGVNGRWTRIKPNQEVEVPLSVLDVLDHAIRIEAEKDEHNRVIGRREVPRFPYSIVRR